MREIDSVSLELTLSLPRLPTPSLQDKAIGRFMVRNMVDAGGLNDLKAASAFDRAYCRILASAAADPLTAQRPFPPPHAAVYVLPKLYSKNYYCVSCAVHSRIVRVRNVQARRVREPPVRFKRTPEKKA